MDVITYPWQGPGILWHLKVIVIKQRWVRVLRSKAAINAVSRLSAICRCQFSAVIRSFGPPSLKRLYQIGRWNRDVGNLMNVTPAIQGYFSSNFSFRLPVVHPKRHVQCRFDILSHLTGHFPARDGSATQSTWCYIRKYVPVNFLRISNENVKYKLVKSPYLLSVS